MYHCHLLTEVASRQNLLMELNDRMKTLILRGHAFPCHLRVAEIDGLSKGRRDKIAVYIFMFHCCSLTLCSKCMSEVQGMCEVTISSKTCIIDVPFSLTFLCDCNRQCSSKEIEVEWKNKVSVLAFHCNLHYVE